MKTKKVLLLAVGLFSLFFLIDFASAQGTAFTYQGQLSASGSPANGKYDFQFSLYPNAAGTGSPIGPSPINQTAIGVTNGLFTTTLDFGAIFTGNVTWLAISVRSNGVGGYSALTPLQELTPTAYAIYAPNAGLAATAGSANSVAAANITGIVQVTQLPASPTFSGMITATSFQSDSSGDFVAGQDNTASGGFATVGGGNGNNASGLGDFIGGGGYNLYGFQFGNIASGEFSVVAGGLNNQAINNYATVPGGEANIAGGQYSFAAGFNAQATNDGSFVWADNENIPFTSTTTNQFSVRAKGGVRFVTSGAGVTVDGQPVAQSYGTAISSAPFTITQPGSFYLTTNLTVSTGDAIDINANGVTLDLNGFTITSTASSATGNAIYLASASGNTDVTIVNGHIVSGVLNDSGFNNGIYANGSPSNIRVSGVSVSDCEDDDIDLGTGNSTIVESCTVSYAGQNGIDASGVITRCTAISCGSTGFQVEGNGVITDCSASGNAYGIGPSADNCIVKDCVVSGNFLNGIGAYLGVNNCSVIACTVNDNGYGYGAGIQIFGNNWIVKDCTVNDNGPGITASETAGIWLNGNDCLVTANNIIGDEGQGGLFILGSQNRIDGNNCNNNLGYGIFDFPNVGNSIIRNSANGNSLINYAETSGNTDFAPIQTPNTATSPWANF